MENLLFKITGLQDGHNVRLLADQAIPRDAAIYIGDRSEDGESADANALPFVAVTWGYGSLRAEELRAGWRAVRQPAQLAALLRAP